MKTGNALKLAAGGLGDELTCHDAPARSMFDGIRLKVKVPVTIAAPITGAVADLLAVLNRAIGSLSLEHGPKDARRLAYASVNGADLRTISRYVAQNEIPNNIVSAALAAGDTTLEATVRIPFRIPWLRGMRKRPGTSQIRRMLLKVIEGGTADNRALGNGITRREGAQITIEVQYENQPGPDLEVPILSLARENSPRRDARGPDGLTLLTYVPTHAAAASPLTAYKLNVGGELVHDVQTVQDVCASFEEDATDAGGGSITDAVTVLYSVPANEKIEELAHGAVEIEQANPDLSPMDLRILYFPTTQESDASAATIAHAEAKRTPVLLTALELPPFANPGAASVAPMRPVTPSDARFVSEPGLVAVPGNGTAEVSIPAPVVRTAEATKALGGVVGGGFARRLQKVTSLRVPGATSSRGKGIGSFRSRIRSTFRGAF